MSAEDSTDDLADEFVLGLLDPVEALRVEEAMATDPVLAAAVASSRDRFLELDATARPMPVPPAMWDSIGAAIDRAPAAQAGAATVAPAVAAASNDNVSRWRILAINGMAAALLLAISLGWSIGNRLEPRVIAVLLDTNGTPMALVEDFGDATARVTPLVDFNVPPGKTMQVWTLPSTDLGPVSLGLLASSNTTVLEGQNLPQPNEDQLYEITVEQEGGSPTGRPTGPILVKGFAKVPR